MQKLYVYGDYHVDITCSTVTSLLHLLWLLQLPFRFLVFFTSLCITLSYIKQSVIMQYTSLYYLR